MKNYIAFLLSLTFWTLHAQQKVEDNFEGNGTINWNGDAASINTSFSNPFKNGINTSNTVLEYKDDGGQYANAFFDVNQNFDLSKNYTFTLKIYIPSSSLTGNQNNQIALKLQDGTLGAPWSTQSEIIKNVTLNQWQEISFNFKDDNYINLDANSDIPTNRKDFNRVLLQVNGENNNDKVIAYIDDFSYDGTIKENTVDTNFDTLVWGDEFDTDGALDNTKWYHQTFGPNGGRWFNGELQHYTDSNTNSYVANGNLHIVAKKETKTQDGVTLDYTSARLNSKYAFKYGKVDVRAKLPKDNGTWPAIWTLGKNISETGAYWQTQGFGNTSWPACGELDVMEHGLHAVNEVSAAIHTPSSNGNTVNTAKKSLTDVSNFHVYSMIWTPEKITFLVDDVMFYEYNPEVKDASTWPFDAEQFLLLNLAVGGFSGNVDANYTQSEMVIDYVRVYQSSANLSVNDNEFKKIEVYPNPTSNQIKFKGLSNFDKTAITIYDVTGKKINTIQLKEAQTSIDVANLKNGLYFISVVQNTNKQSFKIVKQ